MSQIVLPFTFTPDTDANADEVMADLNAILGVANGSLEAGVNVRAGTAGAISSGSSEGSSGFVARNDHTHSVQGVERLTGDPTSGNFVGREYFNTVTLQKRLCVALGAPDSWITTANIAASDLPNHATRHGTGGADPLPANSVAQSMFAARTIYAAVPSADVAPSANAWTDVAIGLAVTVVGTQLATIHVNALCQNTAANSPTVGLRVLDGSSNILLQTGSRQFGASGGGNDSTHIYAAKPVTLTSSPTLKLQVNANATGISVRKSQTLNASTFAVTALEVIVG